jgi:hypothetical protein
VPYDCFSAKVRYAPAGFPLRRVRHKGPLSLTVRTLENKRMQFDDLDPSTTIKAVKLLIQSRHSVPAALQRLNLAENPLDDQKTLDQCGITDETVVDFTVHSRKSMIYLLMRQQCRNDWGNLYYQYGSAEGIEIQLSLDHTLEISTLHPFMKILPGEYVKSVKWSVDLKSSDMALLDRSSGKEVMCLFWDGL